jgi:hypothetical protein
MASDVDIANYALTLLGEARIASLDDEVKAARECKAVYDIARDAILGAYNWRFAFTRALLPALSEAPAFGYDRQFQLPVDCLRIVMVGEFFAGVDLSDYRNAQTAEWTIEGRKLLTDYAAPLPLVYVFRNMDAAQYAPSFVKAFGSELAEQLAEPLTQSDTKRDRATAAKRDAIRLAVRENAIQLPPEKLPDDEWLLSRR